MSTPHDASQDRETLRAAALDLNSAAIHLLRSLQTIDRAAEGDGLTAARLSALSVVVFGGPTSLSRLARAEGVAPPTMVKVVDALCDLGLAERRAHPDHARMVLVAATPRGREAMLAARDRRAAVIASALETLPARARAAVVAAAPHLRELADLIAEPDRLS